MNKSKSPYLVASLAALLAGPAPRLPAQTAAPTETNPDQIVQMSAFAVQTTAGMGYIDGNSVSGFKTNQSLLDIPQAELVMTQDFIKDVGLTETSDLTAYAGVAHFYRGEDPMIRGSRDGFPLLDGMIDVNAYEDSAFVDSIEVLKGPAGVLYAGTLLTGTLVKTTKKPLQFQHTAITAKAVSFGTWRTTLDTTGPVGKLGEVKVSYRLVAAWQGGDAYFQHYKWNVAALHPSLQFDFKNTDVLLAVDEQKILAPGNGNGFLTPTGHIDARAGYKYAGGWFRNMLEDISHRGLRGSVEQKFSDSWSMKLAASFAFYGVYTGNAVNTSTNWQTGTIGGIFRQNNMTVQTWEITDDVLGRYSFGPIKGQSTFGFAHSDNTSLSKFWTLTRPGLANTYTIPMASAAAIDAVYVPQQSAGDYLVPPNPGSRSKTYTDQIYYQEQIDAIPNWLSLVAGWAFIQTESLNDTNIAFNTPYASTDVSFHTYAPRLGAIFHATKNIALYALDTVTAAVNSAVDINNNRLPNVQQTSREAGVKTSLWDGRLVSTVDVYRTTQSNQSVFTGQINSSGVGYYVPVGSTTNQGWEASLEVSPLAGLQIIGTAYKGTVLNQAGQWVSPAFGNSWSLFVRYDFAKGSALHGASFGAGASRIGAKYLSTGGVTFPAGWTAGAFEKVEEGTDTLAFINYEIDRHWTVNLNCTNVLDERYALGVQSAQIVDPSPPRNFSLQLSYGF